MSFQPSSSNGANHFPGPVLQECASTNFTWNGGVPPFILTLGSNLPVSADYQNVLTANQQYSSITTNYLQTKISFASGLLVNNFVTDSVGSVWHFAPATVLPSDDISCQTNVSVSIPPVANEQLRILDLGESNACSPQSVSWIGGYSPFNVSFQGIYTGFNLSQNFYGVQGNQLTTNLPFPSGTTYRVVITDDTWASIVAGPSVVGDGDDSDCVLTTPINAGGTWSSTDGPSPTSSTTLGTSTSAASNSTGQPSITPQSDIASNGPPLQIILPTVFGSLALFLFVLFPLWFIIRRRRRIIRDAGPIQLEDDDSSMMTQSRDRSYGHVEPFVLPGILGGGRSGKQPKPTQQRSFDILTPALFRSTKRHGVLPDSVPRSVSISSSSGRTPSVAAAGVLSSGSRTSVARRISTQSVPVSAATSTMRSPFSDDGDSEEIEMGDEEGDLETGIGSQTVSRMSSTRSMSEGDSLGTFEYALSTVPPSPHPLHSGSQTISRMSTTRSMTDDSLGTIEYALRAVPPTPLSPVHQPPRPRPLSEDIEVPLIIYHREEGPIEEVPISYRASGSTGSLRSVLSRFPSPVRGEFSRGNGEEDEDSLYYHHRHLDEYL